MKPKKALPVRKGFLGFSGTGGIHSGGFAKCEVRSNFKGDPEFWTHFSTFTPFNLIITYHSLPSCVRLRSRKREILKISNDEC